MTGTTMANQVLQNQDKDGMLRRALERIIQLYTDKSHFVYELLQNAEDAGARHIKFFQYWDRLEVLHDGHAFSLDNLQGLCDIGKSDKIDDLNQIGEFGVGFKSVFGICERVKLYSHPTKEEEERGFERFAVEIQDFTRPIDIPDEEIEAGYTTRFIFPYCVGFTFSGFTSIERLNETLSRRLQNLGITTLLFMKNLQAIDYLIDLPNLKTSGAYMLEKIQLNDHCVLASAIGRTAPLENNILAKQKELPRSYKGKKEKGDKQEEEKEEKVFYLVFSRPVTGIRTGRTIDIAFTVTFNENGDYVFRESKYPYISVYFPTETESKLNFIIQGPYRTTPNRSSVPAEDKDNIELARQTSQLLVNSIRELRDEGKLNISLLNILPIEEEVFDSAPLFKCMYTATLNMMKNENILICENGRYSSASFVKIARGDQFAKVFTEDLLSELLNDGKQYYWLPGFLTEYNKKYKKLYEYLTGTLRIEVLRPESLREYFNRNKSFLKRRDNKWLVQMYSLYENVEAAFSKQRSGSGNMLTANIIKTSTGDFVAPYRLSNDKEEYLYSNVYRGYENARYLPNVFLPVKNSANMEGIPFVDAELLNCCSNFFKETLGLQQPNEYEYFIRDFQKRYTSGKALNPDQHMADVKRLLKYYNNDDYRSEIEKLINDCLLLRCFRDGKVLYCNPRRTQIFFSTTPDEMSIEMYFKNIINCVFIDLEYYTKGEIDRKDLTLLGVIDDIAIGRNIKGGEYITGNPGRHPSWSTAEPFQWRLNLARLNEVLLYISKHPDEPDSWAKSSFIFRFLQNNENHLTGTVYISGNTPNLNNEYSLIVKILRKGSTKAWFQISDWNGKWLFTESGKLVSQNEISRRDLNTKYYGEPKEGSLLYDILGFAKNRADKMEEIAKDYDRIPKDKQEQYFQLEFQRRFGISLAEGEELLEGKAKSDFTGQMSGTPLFNFPSSEVKNWEALEKHVAEVLIYADPVKYDYRIRQIRVSKPYREVQAYLTNMYRITGRSQYACQMCHNAFSNVEMCQIANEPEVELDAMNLCFCPTCAAKYKKMRGNADTIKKFLHSITILKDMDIASQDPVKIGLGEESIWFTQSHAAEIKKLLALQVAAENYKEPVKVSKQKVSPGGTKEPDRTYVSQQTITARSSTFVQGHQRQDQQEQKNVHGGMDVYKKLVGKRIYHVTYKAYGKVTAFDGEHVKIAFETGYKKGETGTFSLKILLNKHLIRMA